MEYIGINRAKFKNSKLTLLVNESKNIIYNNFSFFIVTQMCNSSDFNIKRNAYATESEEIGFNILKGNKYSAVYVDYPYIDDINIFK